jgi:hypothetical protein
MALVLIEDIDVVGVRDNQAICLFLFAVVTFIFLYNQLLIRSL